MSRELYACLHVAEFPAQALLRLRPEFAAEPLCVLDGRPPLQSVCSMNHAARRQGVKTGMNRHDAEGIAGLTLLARSAESEQAARAVLLECAAKFSPRVEEATPPLANTPPRRSALAVPFCACVLDIAGTGRIFGTPQMLAQRLLAATADAGFCATIAVSANFHAARLKAAAAPGISVIAAGQEAAALARLPLSLLDLPPETTETFALWGIRTLGELATLPEVELIARFGQQAQSWRNLARGSEPHCFQPIESELRLREFCEFETPVEQMDSLLFTAARMIECLVARAEALALSVAELSVQMKLEGERAHRLVLHPSLPSVDRRFLLKLLQLEIAAHPPQAAVVSLAIEAEPGRSGKTQMGLFAPPTPEPAQLDVTLARLKAMTGEDRVGSPMLEDTHCPGSFRLKEFRAESVSSPKSANPTPEMGAPVGRRHMALRRLRPPVPVRVTFHPNESITDSPHAMRPRAFADGARKFTVVAAYGPWRTSGSWWAASDISSRQTNLAAATGAAWDAEEWDVLATVDNGAPIACLLVYDRGLDRWRLEATYD